MSKKFLIFIIILIVLVGGYFLLFPAKSVNHTNDVPSGFDNNDLDVEIRDMSDVPENYFSGNSRFSNGVCDQDKDCEAMGCSLEICSSDENLMTTCEIGGDFPDKDVYACGCIVDTCGWYPIH